MDLNLTNKRAIVTGGSRGIGKAVARQLAREGCNVIIGARNQGPLDATANEIASESGRAVHGLTFDVSDAGLIKDFVSGAAAVLGGVDILVNNAARTGGATPDNFEEASETQVLKDYEEKFLGYLRCARAVAPYMKESGWGRIINLAGGAGRIRGGLLSSGTRNAAVRQLTITLANALGPSGINVVCVSPGLAITESMQDRYRVQAEQSGKSFDVTMTELAEHTLLRRLIAGDDIANVVTFLCSPLAVAITGTTVDANGGTSPDVRY